ncbi:MAG TPA: ATP-binding protein [Candidatus Dormibacteraeota bacterium]|jgi:two-component system cell cycle sensor histidine kinase/response regulator CckA|nr:ATP-binding protein [Candidatus Dormibacteraeota bacterium]
MRRAGTVFVLAAGLFAAHVAVAIASSLYGPFPLSSHFIQLCFGLFTAVVSLQAAQRSFGLARDFWRFASVGFLLWCLGQALDTYFGLVLNIPFEKRWQFDVFYYAWPAALVICLSLSPTPKPKGWMWERALDFVQAGVLLVMLYSYFADVPLHARGPGVWKLSLVTDGLIAAGFFARAYWADRDPTRFLFQGIGYFRLAAFLTDLYFVLGFRDSTRTNWFDLVWSAQWLIPLLTAAAWKGGDGEARQETTPDYHSPHAQFLPLTFPFLVLLLAAEVAKGQLVMAGAAVAISLSVFYARLILSHRQEEHSIEEKDRAVEALAASEQRLRALFEGSPIGISILDLDGKEIASNEAYRTLVGVDSTEELNLDTLMALTAPETREQDRASFHELASGKTMEARREKKYIRRDGKAVWVDLSAFLQKGPSGKPMFVIAMAINITERKYLEEQLRQSQKMETIGRLAGGVAHDFNNLLTVIKGHSDLVMDNYPNDAPLRTRISHINRAAGRAASLTHQLLAFSRQQVLQPKPLNLNALVSESGKMLARLIGENIEISLSAAAGLGTVLADPGQIEQVILNLVVNARDAMPSGGKLSIVTANVELDEEFAKAHVGARAGQYVLLSVTDTGIGMGEETLVHIFEPFYTTKELGKGTGLGLSMVYGIVKQSNGYIGVTSRLGKGTTFSVYLPRIDAPVEETRQEVELPEKASGNETILIVEDDPEVRALASEVLSTSGYSVLTASCPQDALQLSHQHKGPLHLLVTDLVMPGMSGHDMATKLRESWPGIPILFMSGYTDPEIVQAPTFDSSSYFLQKPFTPATLTHLIREILHHPVQST